MMLDKHILIDTDVLIDVSRKIPSAIQTIEGYKPQFILSVSMVTQLELINGCQNKKERNQLSEFLERFEILHINETISTKTVELFEKYRLSHGVHIPDMLIASTALTTPYHWFLRTEKISHLSKVWSSSPTWIRNKPTDKKLHTDSTIKLTVHQ